MTEERDPRLTALGAIVRERREAEGGVAGKWADMVRMSLYRIEKGEANPSYLTIAQLAKAMGLEVSELCGMMEERARSVEMACGASSHW